MNTTTEKENMSKETMPRKKRTWLYVLLVLIALISFHIKNSYYIRWGVQGLVRDKETGKPISYALVKFRTAYGNDRATTKDITTVVADTKGYYFFPTRISDAKSFTWSKPGFYAWTGQELQVWFPGYKKFVATTQDKEVFKGKMDISLERPETAEEAVEELKRNLETGWFVNKPVTVRIKVILQEGKRIMRTYPKTIWADKAYNMIGNYLDDQYGRGKDNDIFVKNEFSGISCEDLFEDKWVRSCEWFKNRLSKREYSD